MGSSQSQENAAQSTAVVSPVINSSGSSGGDSGFINSSGLSSSSTAEMEHRTSNMSPIMVSGQTTDPELPSWRGHEGECLESETDEDDSVLMTFHTLLARSLREVGETSQVRSNANSRSGDTPETEGAEGRRGERRHQEPSSSRGGDGRHHHHHHSRQHHDSSSHARHAHGDRPRERRRRRHTSEDVQPSSEPFGLELGVSLSALNERLRALQGREGEGRHGGRHRSRTTGPLFFFRASDRSKF